jgi:hypothetical protein
MMIRRASMCLGMSVLVALAISAPAAASHTSSHAIEEVLTIRDQGLAEMDAVVADFQADVASVTTQAEVDQARAAAEDAVETAWTSSKTAIEDLNKLYPGELKSITNQAKQDLQARRNTARTEIRDIADAWTPAPSSTTTSTTIPTTTTTIVDTTTTSSGPGTTPGNNGNGPPAGGNGNGNGNGGNGNGDGNGLVGGETGTDNGATSSGTGDPGPSLPAAPDVVGGEPAPTGVVEPNDVIDQLALAVPAFTPVQGNSSVPESVAELVASGPAVATERMSAVLDTVLPPAVVDLVLSPLLVLEILVRTTLQDGQRVLAPLILLAIAAIVIAVADRFAKRQAAA